MEQQKENRDCLSAAREQNPQLKTEQASRCCREVPPLKEEIDRLEALRNRLEGGIEIEAALYNKQAAVRAVRDELTAEQAADVISELESAQQRARRRS